MLLLLLHNKVGALHSFTLPVIIAFLLFKSIPPLVMLMPLTQKIITDVFSVVLVKNKN